MSQKIWGKFKSGKQSTENEGPVVGAAENGFTMIRYARKRIEEKQFKIKPETREIVWNRHNAQKDSG